MPLPSTTTCTLTIQFEVERSSRSPYDTSRWARTAAESAVNWLLRNKRVKLVTDAQLIAPTGYRWHAHGPINLTPDPATD